LVKPFARAQEGIRELQRVDPAVVPTPTIAPELNVISGID
jgi:hypothetical protein